MHIIVALLLLCSKIASASAERKGSAEYLRTECSTYTQHYEPLVRSQLDSLPLEINLAGVLRKFSTEHQEHSRLSDEAFGWPVLFIVDGVLYGEK